jgi:hypothetical protein
MWDVLSSWWIIGTTKTISLIYGILLRGRLYIGRVTSSDAYLQRRKTELFFPHKLRALLDENNITVVLE